MLSVACLVTLAVGLFQDDPNSANVVAPGAKLEKVWGEGSFTEGGALDSDGSLLFSDIGNRIMKFDPKSGKTTVFREPSGRANGMVFDVRGQLIVAEGANTGGARRYEPHSRR
jgi:gluconolactonase